MQITHAFLVFADLLSEYQRERERQLPCIIWSWFSISSSTEPRMYRTDSLFLRVSFCRSLGNGEREKENFRESLGSWFFYLFLDNTMFSGSGSFLVLRIYYQSTRENEKLPYALEIIDFFSLPRQNHRYSRLSFCFCQASSYQSLRETKRSPMDLCRVLFLLSLDRTICTFGQLFVFAGYQAPCPFQCVNLVQIFLVVVCVPKIIRMNGMLQQ